MIGKSLASRAVEREAKRIPAEFATLDAAIAWAKERWPRRFRALIDHRDRRCTSTQCWCTPRVTLRELAEGEARPEGVVLVDADGKVRA